MLFAIEEINNSTDLLPGISMGYSIHDACGSIARGVKVALGLNNGNDNASSTFEEPCTSHSQVLAVLGETSSSPSTAIATILGPFHIPLVSQGFRSIADVETILVKLGLFISHFHK